jgi:hypothetical protein
MCLVADVLWFRSTKRANSLGNNPQPRVNSWTAHSLGLVALAHFSPPPVCPIVSGIVNLELANSLRKLALHLLVLFAKGSYWVFPIVAVENCLYLRLEQCFRAIEAWP